MTDYTWDGGGDGTSWNDADNWGGSDYPRTNNDKATINTGSASISMDISGGSGVVGEVDLGSSFTGTVTQAFGFTIDDAGSENGALEINNANATWNCNGSALTVDSHISGNGTFTVGASTVTCTGQTTTGTFNITTGTYNYFDDFRPTTANITDNATFNQTSTGGQFGGRVIIGSGKTPTFNAIGRLHSSLDIRSGEQGNSTFNLDLSEPQTSGGPARDLYFYSLEIDSQGTENNTYTLQGGLYCTNTLTITDGIIDTKSGVSHALQVTKHLDIGAGGTLTGRGSSISTGTMTIRDGGTLTNSGTITVTGEDVANSPSGGNWLWRQLEDDGTGFAPTAGTVHFNHASNLNGKHLNESKFYNLTLTAGTGHDVAWTPKTANTLTVSNDLTIVEGQLKRNNEADTFVVTEDVSIESGGVLGDNDETGPNTFGSLTIADGGTYKATSGTTTITNEKSHSGDGYAWKNEESDGTGFVHNNGKVKIDFSSVNSATLIREDTWYDLELVGYTTNNNITTMDIDSSNAITILGDVSATNCTFNSEAVGDALTVHGLTTIASNARFGSATGSRSGTVTHHGLVTNSGTYFTSSGTNNLNGGVRNLGTFTSDDTLTIGGTGGIIEGNLGSANINVNLDPVLTLDGSADYLTASSANFGAGHANGTLSAWIKTTSSAGQVIFGAADTGTDNFYMVLYLNAGKLYLDHKNTSVVYQLYVNETINDGSWHHVLVESNGSTISMAIDGVSKTVSGSTNNGDWFGDVSNLDNVSIGAYTRTSTSAYFNGSIADVRYYYANLVDSDKALLASKIGVTTATTPTNWWKLNDGEITGGTNYEDFGSATDIDLVATSIVAGNIDYDAFSVNVQDNSTTGDGTFTITQGKVEGLSLSSLDFDGTNDYVDIGELGDYTAISMTAWVNPDDATPTSQGMVGFEGNQNGIATGSGSNVLRIKHETVGNNGAGNAYTDTTYSWLQNKWQQVGFSWDGSTLNVFADGVKINSVSLSGSAWGTSNADIGSLTNTTWPFNGNIRDVRLYDYGLSDDQMASLYSGSYNVTPTHWWKIDDGGPFDTGMNTITDSGTATAVNGTRTGGAAWTSGDFRPSGGVLTISANGTLSAPRGNLKYGSSSAMVISNANGIIHNKGTLYFDRSGGTTFQLADGVPQTWYNWHIEGSTSTDLNWSSGYDDALTIENQLNIESGAIFKPTTGSQGRNLVMGTSSAAGSIVNNGNFYLDQAGSTHLMISGASSLYPCVCTGTNWNWDYNTSGAGKAQLSNLDIQFAVVTQAGSSNADIQLTGDCEFDAVTVSSGSVLDLNGQRMECSGTLTNAGTIDVDGGLVFASDFDLDGSYDNESGLNAMVMTGTGNFDFGDGEFTHGTFMINSSGTATMEVDQTMGNLLVGAGTLAMGADQDNAMTGLTVATGGTLTASSATLTSSGDFTTSGGLLGASCLELNGSSEYAAQTSATTWNFGDAFSVEMWFKSTANESAVLFDMYNGSNNNNRISIFNNGGTSMAFKCYNSGGSVFTMVSSTVDPDDGKWHHVACTSSGTAQTIHYDGKLIGSFSNTIDRDSDPSMRLYVGCDKDVAYHWDGCIDNLRIYHDVRTEAEIRTYMFDDSPSGAGTNNLNAQYLFNEGTGTAIDNLQGTSARDLVLSDAGAWAGAGTFTYGTSTLVMSGSSKTITFIDDEEIYNLTTSGTITLNGITDTADLRLNGTLNASGTLSSTASETIMLLTGSTVGIGTAGTSIANLYKLRCRPASGTVSIPACTTKWLQCETSSTTTQATGDLTISVKLGTQNSHTFDANGNTINVVQVENLETSTLNLSNSTLNFYSGTGDSWTMAEGTTLTTGNTTVTGANAGTPAGTPIYMPTSNASSSNFEIVGDVSLLVSYGETDLTVIGSVTNCTKNSAGSIIRQFHHTLDTQQLLDADEKGDDDHRLTKPALDNAAELMTG